jgi:hypothetical protein
MMFISDLYMQNISKSGWNGIFFFCMKIEWNFVGKWLTQGILLSTNSRSQTFNNQFEQKKPKLVDNEKPSPKKIRGVCHNIATFFRSLF